MISGVVKVKENVACPHCGKKSDEVWILKYESSDFIRIIFICVECGEVVKIKEEGLAENQQIIFTN